MSIGFLEKAMNLLTLLVTKVRKILKSYKDTYDEIKTFEYFKLCLVLMIMTTLLMYIYTIVDCITLIKMNYITNTSILMISIVLVLTFQVLLSQFILFSTTKIILSLKNNYNSIRGNFNQIISNKELSLCDKIKKILCIVVSMTFIFLTLKKKELFIFYGLVILTVLGIGIGSMIVGVIESKKLLISNKKDL